MSQSFVGKGVTKCKVRANSESGFAFKKEIPYGHLRRYQLSAFTSALLICLVFVLSDKEH